MINVPSFPRTQRIGILVFNDFEPLDVWGFIEVFSISRFIGTDYDDAPPYPFEIVLISNERCTSANGTPTRVKSYNGPYVSPDLYRDDALTQPFDLLMIPGGQGVGELLMSSDLIAVQGLVEWVVAMDARVRLMTSVCTGAAILAHAGVLDGHPAATNHEAFAWVTGFGTKVLWNNVARWVDTGHYVTSAGVSAGTDMAFHLVARLAGHAVAETAVISAEYDWHRDPDQPFAYPQQAVVPTSR